MFASAETQLALRQLLLVGPYGVLGAGVIDAVAENPKWSVTTAARRPVPIYRAQVREQEQVTALRSRSPGSSLLAAEA